MKTVQERTDADLLELVCKLHSRSLMYPESKEMHNAANEARKEMDSRLAKNEWIPCSKPPRINEEVQVCNVNDEWVVGGYYDGKEWWNQFEDKISGDCSIIPTHWKLFSELPK